MITVNSDCTGCGRCAQVCPAYVIPLEGKPRLEKEGCIRCGHCEAVCPHGALSNSLLPADSAPELGPPPEAEAAALFLRSRRSVRCFLDKPVPREEIRRLVDIGRYAQTGSNRQGVSYLVVAGDKVKALREQAVDYFGSMPNLDPQRARALFDDASGRDRMFRGAPVILLALTPADRPELAGNARYSLTYVELYAPSLGLGTCWAGYLENYTNANKPALRELLEIPADKQVSGALMLGYPQYGYRTAVKRDPLEVCWR